MAEPLRVLIVDDNRDHAHLAAEFLAASGPYRIEIAGSLHGLWANLAREAFDVVLLDYDLPDGDGLEALAEFSDRGYHVPVVMVTGRGDERVAAQAIQRGAMDYLVKADDYLLTLPALVDKAARAYQIRQLAQRSLEQIRYQALLLENVQDAVVVWDVEGRLTFWNYSAERLFGWRADERIGQWVHECHLPMLTPPVKLPEPGDPSGLVDVERRGVNRNGETIWLSSNVSVLLDSVGHVRGYMDVSRDISSRKRLEAQVQAAQTQLAQAARLAAIGELASGVAHQINNPLTSIIGEAQILLRGLPAEHPARESAETIERAGWRVQKAVQRLMEFSRPATSSLESLSVNETIEHACELVEVYLATRGVTIELSLAPGLPRVYGNARQLEDLWVNLLLMARDRITRQAAEDGQPHHIRLASSLTPESQVCVRVNDDGELIEPTRLITIFEPDFVAALGGRGTGLELSICREIVRQHRGQVSAESAPGAGNIFTIFLPPEISL